jgi:site-specific DNA-methyltransferase (adenine-specific)
VQFVEKMDNIDTTQTTQNLLKLFGYVKVVITNYILGNIEYDQKRYIYTPKASKKDRDEGLDEFEEKNTMCDRNPELASANMPQNRSGNLRKNTHPTVKPTALMQYLVRLVTPKGGIILDPFMGSGSTGKAVMFENKERQANYSFIGIEKEKEYCDIAKARIEWAKNYKDKKEEDNQIHIDELGGLI